MDVPNPQSATDVAAEASKASKDEIAAFLDHIHNRKCEACNTNQWIFDQGELYQFVRVGDLDQGMAVLCLLCSNCGNTRTFSWGRIRYFINNEYKKCL